MTATSATSRSRLRRAEILVNDKPDIIMDVASYSEPGEYDLEFLSVDSDGYVSFRYGKTLPFWSQLMVDTDLGSGDKYTLRVIQERASKD